VYVSLGGPAGWVILVVIGESAVTGSGRWMFKFSLNWQGFEKRRDFCLHTEFSADTIRFDQNSP
jgi:hypothetical protein